METTPTRAVCFAAFIALLVLAALASFLCVELTTGEALYGGAFTADAASLHREGEALSETVCGLLPPRAAAAVSLLQAEAYGIRDVIHSLCT